MGKHSKTEENREPQTVAEVKKQIEACKQAMGLHYQEMQRLEKKLDPLIAKEWNEKARRQDQLLTLVPFVNAKKSLDGRKIEIIYTNRYSKDQRRGAKALEAPGLDVARELDAFLREVGVSATVTARTWSTTRPGLLEVPLDAENETRKLSPNRNFAIPAQFIKNESESDNEQDKGKRYIVITSGDIYGGDIQGLVENLGALKSNHQATLDFIVCSEAEKTPVETLVKAMKARAAGPQVNFAKVSNESEILDAIKGVIKSHVTAGFAPKVEAAPKHAKKRRGFFRRRKTGLNA